VVAISGFASWLAAVLRCPVNTTRIQRPHGSCIYTGVPKVLSKPMAMAIRRSLEKVIRGIEGLTRTIERVAGRADYTGVSIGPKSQKPISQPSLNRWVRNTRNAQGRIGYQNSDALRSTRCQKAVDRHRGTRCNPLK
jgi:hypothetical protein